MRCPVSQQSVIVEVLSQLADLDSRKRACAVGVNEDIEYYYERDYSGWRSVPNTITAMFDVQACRDDKSEYAITRRLCRMDERSACLE